MRLTSLFLILIIPFLSSCCSDPVNGESYFCLGEVSNEAEVQMGLQYQPNFIAQNSGIYPDQELYSHLNDIVINKLAKKSHRPNLPWEFHILNTSQINAFAIPGGQVFVTRGLLAELETEAQFAALMGHEIGHVTHRHSIRGQNRQQLLGILVGLGAYAEGAMREEGETLIFTGAGAMLGNLVGLKFSRDQEVQSDMRGLDYSSQAGYDPREASKTFEMFQRLKNSSGAKAGLVENLLSTHPTDERRIDEINSYLSKHPEQISGTRVISTPRWDANLAKLRAAHRVYKQHDQAEKLIQEAASSEAGASKTAKLREARAILEHCISELPNHGKFHALLGLVETESNQFAKASAHYDRAVSLDPNLFEARYYRGLAAYKGEKYREAKADLVKAQGLFPMHPLPCYSLGQNHEALRETSSAIEWYEATIQRSAEDSPIHIGAKKALERLSPTPAEENKQ